MQEIKKPAKPKPSKEKNIDRPRKGYFDPPAQSPQNKSSK